MSISDQIFNQFFKVIYQNEAGNFILENPKNEWIIIFHTFRSIKVSAEIIMGALRMPSHLDIKVPPSDTEFRAFVKLIDSLNNKTSKPEIHELRGLIQRFNFHAGNNYVN